jgi:S1-C subfamily serine protease
MRPLAILLLLAFAAGCATGPRAVEPLPGDGAIKPEEGLQRALLSVVGLVVEQGDGDSFGSGVILDNAGHIMTVHHVVEGAQRILVLLSGGYTVRAQLVASDPVSDFAVIRAETWIGDRMEPAIIAPSLPRPGAMVWNLGNPFGTSRFGGEPSVGHGVISALQRSYLNEETGRLYLNAIQHDAPTNPGNSGGGIFDAQGRLLGLNALITTMRETPGDSGVAFAMPAAAAREKALRLLRGEVITHGWFGEVRYKQATEMFAGGYGRLRVVFGPLVDASPASVAGVMPGDVLIKIDAVEVYGMHEALTLEDSLVPGQTVKLTINRAGLELEFPVTVAERPWAGS